MTANTDPTKEVEMDVAAELAAMHAEFEATLAAVPNMKTMQKYRTGFGGELTVNMVGYGHVEVEDVLNGTATAEVVVLTQDGGSANYQEWHDGAPNDEWVYYERWTPTGRVAHGYVDAITRKLVQAG